VRCFFPPRLVLRLCLRPPVTVVPGDSGAVPKTLGASEVATFGKGIASTAFCAGLANADFKFWYCVFNHSIYRVFTF